jgi:hypothetical protein
LNVVAKDPKDEARSSPPIDARGHGVELASSCGPAACHRHHPRRRRVSTATGQVVERDVGYAVLASEGFGPSTRSFAEPGDLHLLGTRAGVMVDALGHRLVAVTTVAAGGRRNPPERPTPALRA